MVVFNRGMEALLIVCVSVCVCVCVCVHVYVCIHVCVYACIHMCVCVCVYACIHACVFVYACIHACVCVCVYMHTCVCVCVCVCVCLFVTTGGKKKLLLQKHNVVHDHETARSEELWTGIQMSFASRITNILFKDYKLQRDCCHRRKDKQFHFHGNVVHYTFKKHFLTDCWDYGILLLYKK